MRQTVPSLMETRRRNSLDVLVRQNLPQLSNLLHAQVAAKLQALLKELLDCLKAAKAEKQPSTLTLAAIHAASDLVQSRPGQAGRILPTLLSASGSLAVSCTLAAASIQKCLKRVLWSLVSHPAAALLSWKPKAYFIPSPCLLLSRFPEKLTTC